MLKDSFTSCKSSSRFLLTSFIGYKQEIIDIKLLLHSTRLLTFWGPGGCGKSRLAFQIVTEITGCSYRGVWWVDLDTLTDSAQLLQRIAQTIGINEQADFPLIDQLLAAIRCDNGLLILDNCDHLIAECSQLVETLLLSCPLLRILVTSREALTIAGETVWHVPPLSVPDPHHLPALGELIHYEAVELFIVRAMAVQPAFLLTEANALKVASICHYLDGLPLAIELAALRMKVLAVEQIVAQLDDCCQFLTSGYRTASSRHQSLRTTIDWSYHLLSEKERYMLHRLSVFMDNFTLVAAEAQCKGEELEENEIFPLLLQLVDKSFLVIEHRKTDVRFRLLEMIRQYSHDKFSANETEDIRKWQEKQRQLDTPVCFENTQPPPKVLERGVHLSIPAIAHQKDALQQPAIPEAREIETKSSEIRIFVFGQAQIYRGKQILTHADWKYAKARELLFYLLCHPLKSKEQIGLALWPDASSSQLRSNFHSTLHHLRKALGGTEWVIFEHGFYTFNHSLDYWFDLETFESSLARAQEIQIQSSIQAIQHLQKGIELYKGDFLESITSLGDWYHLRQKDLRRKYLDALFTLGQLYFADDQYKQAANAYRRIISSDNLEEAAHYELMRCYVRQGKRSQAVRHYQELVKILKNELNAPPEAKTKELFERFRRGEEV